MYFIKIENGKIVGHPVAEENLKSAFPELEFTNTNGSYSLSDIEDGWAQFKRINKPPLKVYEICEGNSYEFDGKFVRDVWHIRNMTDQEKLKIQEFIKSKWNSCPLVTLYPSWVFDINLCDFVPPIPKPDDRYEYIWRESDTSWVLVPAKPLDHHTYDFDLDKEVWIKRK